MRLRRGVVAGGALVALCGLPARAQDTAPGDALAAAAPAPPPAPAPDPSEAIPSPPPPPASTRWELAAAGGYMTAPIPGAITPLGGGIGGRFGVDLSGVYLGAASTYYFGGTDSGASESTVLFGGELGYGVRLSNDFTLRPLVGLGGALISHSEPLSTTSTGTTSSGRRGRGGADVVSSASGGNSNTTRVTTFYVKPGLAAIYGIGADFFVGVGADILFVPKVTYTDGSVASWLAYGANGQFGKRF